MSESTPTDSAPGASTQTTAPSSDTALEQIWTDFLKSQQDGAPPVDFDLPHPVQPGEVVLGTIVDPRFKGLVAAYVRAGEIYKAYRENNSLTDASLIVMTMEEVGRHIAWLKAARKLVSGLMRLVDYRLGVQFPQAQNPRIRQGWQVVEEEPSEEGVSLDGLSLGYVLQQVLGG